MGRKTVIAAVATAVVAVIVTVAVRAELRDGDDPRRPAPAVAGATLDGGRYQLADHLGDVVVVNFWASWCAPCRVEIDDLEQTYQSTKDKGVSFVGINIRDDRDRAKAFIEGRTSYPSIFDPAGTLSVEFARFGATTTPATVIVDRQGRVAKVLRNAVTRQELEPIVAEVAAEPRP